MIKDHETRSAIARDWAVVRKLCTASRQILLPGFGVFSETPPDEYYNLPLLLAYAVLDQVLSELIDQGMFQCTKKKPLLGDKMVASQNHLSWSDYAFVESGKNARNELAHEARLLDKSRCFSYIDAIEVELTLWSVI